MKRVTVGIKSGEVLNLCIAQVGCGKSRLNEYELFLEHLNATLPQFRGVETMKFSLSFDSPHMVKLIALASLLKYFDKNILNKLTNNKVSNVDYGELINKSYIEKYPISGMYNVHELSTKQLLYIIKHSSDLASWCETMLPLIDNLKLRSDVKFNINLT